MPTTKHQCEKCNGWGFLHQHHKPCKICGGTGYIIDIKDESMSEPKPPYTVNPAVLKSIPAPAPDAKLQEAFSETVRLIREALQVSAPFTGSKGSIAVNYETWDTQCNVLLAIREKCNNWETVTPSTTLYAFSLFREISNLLTKAGY